MIILKPVLRAQHTHYIHNMEMIKLLFRQNHKCFYCNKAIVLETISRDHLFPKCDGFTLKGNLVLAHKRCNSLKGNMYPSVDQIIRWVAIHPKKEKARLMVKTLNGKPVFKLKMTPELIHDYLS